MFGWSSGYWKKAEKISDLILLTKVHLVKAMVFPVVMYGCESWTIKKAEHPRIDAFALWCWRRFLRIPWTSRRSNQSIIKEINPEHSLEGLMLKLKLKLQYFGHLMQRANSLEKTLILGKIEGRRRRGRERMRWLCGITDSMDMSLSKVREIVVDRKAWRAVIHGVAKSWTGLSDWTSRCRSWWVWCESRWEDWKPSYVTYEEVQVPSFRSSHLWECGHRWDLIIASQVSVYMEERP